MVSLHRRLFFEPIEIIAEVFEFSVIWIPTPCVGEDAILRGFGEDGRRVVDDDDLREIFGDFAKGFFVGFVAVLIRSDALFSSPDGEAGDSQVVKDGIEVGELSSGPHPALKILGNVFEKRLCTGAKARIEFCSARRELYACWAIHFGRGKNECFIHIKYEFLHIIKNRHLPPTLRRIGHHHRQRDKLFYPQNCSYFFTNKA